MNYTHNFNATMSDEDILNGLKMKKIVSVTII